MAELYIGLISGTSADGIDAALVDLGAPRPRLRHALTEPYAPALREELLAFMGGRYRDDPVDQLCRLDREVGEAFGAAARRLLKVARTDASAVRAIGSHGQTLRHRPPVSTLQVGDPNAIAVATSVPVVADLRRKDIVLGGQGAPLVPAFHAEVLGAEGERRAIINIGGFANITRLAPGSEVAGGDIGPGNALLDGWCALHLGQPFDAEGAWARGGRVEPALLDALLAEPYFAQPMPKSTGRELFSIGWLERALGGRGLAPRDVQATLAELTARTIANAVLDARADRAYVCGGGAHNADLMERISRHLDGIPLATTDALGVPADHVEAMAFAWLAQRTLSGRAGNLPSVTGAARAAVLGAVWSAD